MKVGLAFASSIAIDGPASLEICQRAEAAGFESVWGGEHVVLPDSIHSKYPYTEDGKIPAEPDTPIPDPLIWLAFAAAAAPTLRLGTCILIVPQRNPLVLAKELQLPQARSAASATKPAQAAYGLLSSVPHGSSPTLRSHWPTRGSWLQTA